MGTDAAAYVALLAEGHTALAYDVARQHNPFPSVCGRVCSAPCEQRCRRGVVDSAVSIRALKRVLCDEHGAEQGDASRWQRGAANVPAASRPSVAIVGAGPAGLAAAHDLRLAGHAVTVFEAASDAGGMMRFGIPAFRLPRETITAEIDAILALGITLRLDCAVGRDVQLTALLAEHAAVLVTVGCQLGRPLPVPGAELPGVVRAVDFLRLENVRAERDPASPAPGTKSAKASAAESARADTHGPAIVVGGGSVAFDAARSAWRAGAMSAYDGQTALDAARSARRRDASDRPARMVTMVAPEPRDALPVPAEELEEATVEGVQLRDQHGVVRIVGDTHVEGVEIAPVTALTDAEGRFAPQLDLSRTERVDATLVVLAIGQQADTDFLHELETVERSAWGGVVVDAQGCSSDPRVWAAGDVASGPRDLIDAVAAGQRAAAGIARQLQPARSVPAGRRAIHPPSVATAPPLHADTRFWSGFDSLSRRALPVIASSSRDVLTEVEQSWSRDEARVEASRCLRCDEQMQFHVERCIACALCVDVCPQASLDLTPTSGASLALLFNDDTCIRCGLCVHRCPTDALYFELAPAAERGVALGLATEVEG